MKVYELGIYEKAFPKSFSWEEKLKNAHKLGFDYIEMSVDESNEKLVRLDMKDSEIEELRKLSFSEDMPIKSMCLSGHRKYPFGSNDPIKAKMSIEMMQKAITLASKLGIRIIQLAGYDVYYEESTANTKEQFENNLRLAVNMASSQGVMLGFETMETSFMNTVEKAMFYVNKINSPWLKVYPDIGNLTNAASGNKELIVEDLKKGLGSIIAMHLKETKPGIFREVDFGTGHVDFELGIRNAWEMGIRRFTIECWDIGEPDWYEKLSNNKSYFCEIFDKQYK